MTDERRFRVFATCDIGPALNVLRERGYELEVYGNPDPPPKSVILEKVRSGLDGLLLQPYLMKRQNRVPIWASIVAPLLLGFFFHIWGVLASGPLLAIVYAFRNKRHEIGPGGGEAPTTRNQRLSA